jgi:hypothetical protein
LRVLAKRSRFKLSDLVSGECTVDILLSALDLPLSLATSKANLYCYHQHTTNHSQPSQSSSLFPKEPQTTTVSSSPFLFSCLRPSVRSIPQIPRMAQSGRSLSTTSAPSKSIFQRLWYTVMWNTSKLLFEASGPLVRSHLFICHLRTHNTPPQRDVTSLSSPLISFLYNSTADTSMTAAS